MAEAHNATPEVANIISLLHELFKGNSIVEFLHHNENAFFSGLIIIALAIFARFAARHRAMMPGKWQNFVEMVMESLDNITHGVLGHHGRAFTPFIGTLFIYIFMLNICGIIPGLKAPSSNLNTTVGLAITVFFYVQYTGIKRNGIGGYFFHLLGNPKDITGYCFIPLMFPLHVVEEFIKPMSLSLRLYGNMFGEDSLIGVFVSLGIVALSFAGKTPVGLPFQIPFMLLAIITSVIQALVFSMLSTIYIMSMLPHEEEHHDEHHLVEEREEGVAGWP